MADPISTASGLLALVVFAFNSSKLLYQTVASFQSNQRTVRDLKEELQTLGGVLQSLLETATKTDIDLTTLKLPLLRCGKACKDFDAVIAKCTAHSGGSRTSFRDWAKLRYMEEDIAGFKNVLAQYKSTISIAIGDATIRTAAVTFKVLKEYKDMIANTTADLEEHLQKIDSKLNSLSLQDPTISDEAAAQRQQMQEERDSTKHCLDICAKFSMHIDQLQPLVYGNTLTNPALHERSAAMLNGFTPAREVTVDTIKAFRERLAITTIQLENNLQNINNRLQDLPSQPLNSENNPTTEKESIEEELASTKQCLAICAEASREADKDRTNVFEDISMADDGYQVFVSTIGDLVTAKRVNAGARSMQLLGQMSDMTLQQFSRDFGHITMEKATEPDTRRGAQFEDRYDGLITMSITGKGQFVHTFASINQVFEKARIGNNRGVLGGGFYFRDRLLITTTSALNRDYPGLKRMAHQFHPPNWGTPTVPHALMRNGEVGLVLSPEFGTEQLLEPSRAPGANAEKERARVFDGI